MKTILIQAIGIAACLNYGGKPFIQPSGNYVGCYVDKATYSLVMADLKDRKTLFSTLKP
jgi:hypothetical protein